MQRLNGDIFKKMLRSAQANLSNNQKRIDALNVFPVPDGDTGLNMSMTFTSGVNNCDTVFGNELNEVARALSKGLLMGARGNSGVITSQIFRGFYQYLENDTSADVEMVARAFVNGSEVAYKAIMKPVEGTILTVIREGSNDALNYVYLNANCSIEQYFEKLVEYMNRSLDKTPELLPVLKEVGVVDSGGSGLVSIIEGMNCFLQGKEVVADESLNVSWQSAALELENDEFGYCTEFIVELNEEWNKKFDENKLRKSLNDIGNSLVVVRDEELVKVHVHTLRPGDALNIGQRYGEFIKLKIENMQQQHSNIKEGVKDVSFVSNHPQMNLPKFQKYGLIAVAAGKGLIDLFKEYRADFVISGGQTMNPSTEDFVEAVKKLNVEHVIILPNNSNIVLAAKQAKDVLEDYDITVLETKSIQEGLCALSMFDFESDLDTNIENMTQAYKNVLTGSITYAIKDTSFEGVEVKEGDFIGMTNKKIICSNKDRMIVIKELINEMSKNDDKELLTIYVGEDGSKDEALLIEEYIVNMTDFEVEIIQSDQPVYSYLFGLE